MAQKIDEVIKACEDGMSPLDNLAAQGLTPEHIACVATVEQVRATYALVLMLAGVREVLLDIKAKIDGL